MRVRCSMCGWEFDASSANESLVCERCGAEVDRSVPTNRSYVWWIVVLSAMSIIPWTTFIGAPICFYFGAKLGARMGKAPRQRFLLGLMVGVGAALLCLSVAVAGCAVTVSLPRTTHRAIAQ